MKQLGELQGILSELNAIGAGVVAIAPDTPDLLNKTRAALKLEFPLLSDPSMASAQAFGIAFEQTSPQYESLLERASGMDHHLLPVPSVFLVSPKRTIQFSHVDPAYQQRPPAALLAAVAKAYSE